MEERETRAPRAFLLGTCAANTAGSLRHNPVSRVAYLTASHVERALHLPQPKPPHINPTPTPLLNSPPQLPSSYSTPSTAPLTTLKESFTKPRRTMNLSIVHTRNNIIQPLPHHSTRHPLTRLRPQPPIIQPSLQRDSAAVILTADRPCACIRRFEVGLVKRGQEESKVRFRLSRGSKKACNDAGQSGADVGCFVGARTEGPEAGTGRMSTSKSIGDNLSRDLVRG